MNKHNWTYKKLGEVATFINGYPFKPSQWGLRGRKIIRIQNLNNPNAVFNCYDGDIDSKYLVSNGDVLISWSGSLGVFEWSQEEAIVNQHIFKVVFNKEVINKRFFEYVVSSRLNEMKTKVHGITMQHITKKDFDAISIPIPPVEEQERIVGELDLISSIIDKKKAQLSEYDQLAQSIFYTMFGDPITNEKGWELKKLNDLSNVFAGGDVPKDSFSKTKSEKYSVPIYSNGIDNDGLYGYTAKARVSEPSITISGRGTIGFVALRNHPFYPIIRLIVITPIIPIDLVYLKFVCTAMNFKGVGVAIPQLTVPMIKFANIPIPPFSLQQEFAEKIEAIERQKALVQQSIDETQTMFDYTMDKYFG